MPHTHRNEPAAFLVEHAPLLPRGRALDVAMGGGRNAVYLAGLGLEVTGVDASPEAVAAARAAAQKAGVKLDARLADLEAGYEIEKEAYDVIVCFNYLHRPLLPQIKAGLKPGGVIVYETFITDQAALFGKPRNPAYLLRHNELLEAFRGLRCLRYREGVIDGNKAVAGIVAQRETG